MTPALRDASSQNSLTLPAMRLYPVIPFMPPRVANKDTVLPLGGGKDGKAPLFAPKGTRFIYDFHSVCRRRDIWGEDVDEFKPERWATARPGWNFTPFGGGPRICVGRKYIPQDHQFRLNP